VQRASFVVEVLVERARELFIGVHRALVEHGLERAPRAGVILTGGGSRLEGLVEEAEVIFSQRARIGTPRALAGLTEPVAGPEWAVACGLVRLQGTRRHPAFEAQAPRSGILAWLRSTFGEFFTWEVDHDRV